MNHSIAESAEIKLMFNVTLDNLNGIYEHERQLKFNKINSFYEQFIFKYKLEIVKILRILILDNAKVFFNDILNNYNYCFIDNKAKEILKKLNIFSLYKGQLEELIKEEIKIKFTSVENTYNRQVLDQIVKYIFKLKIKFNC